MEVGKTVRVSQEFDNRNEHVFFLIVCSYSFFRESYPINISERRLSTSGLASPIYSACHCPEVL